MQTNEIEQTCGQPVSSHGKWASQAIQQRHEEIFDAMIDDTADWATYLKPLQFAHNTAINKSTMYTPHYLTFLQDPRLPDTIMKPTMTYSPTYAADAFQRLQYAYNLVFKNNEEARQAYTAHFNKKLRTQKFDIGDEVLVTFPVHAKFT